MLEHLITEICEKLSLPLNLEKDKEGYYTFTLNPEISLSLKELQPGFFIRAKLGPAPEGSHEELYIHLMKANYLGQGTAGAFIGMDEKAENFTLTKACRHETTYKEFKDLLEVYINYYEYWKVKIAKYNETQTL